MRPCTLEKLNNQRADLIEACNSKALHKVAREFRVSLKTLQKWLSLNGIHPQRVIDKMLSQEVISYYNTHSQRDTAKHFHMDVGTLRKILDREGVAFRTAQEAKELFKQQNLEHYGVEYSTQRQEVRDKIAATNRLKYGSSSPLGNQEVRQKADQTMIQRYGTTNYNNPSQRESTCLGRYGTRSASGNPEVREKIKQTSLERFGVENPSCNEEVKLKIAQTKQSKYGGYGWDAPLIRAKYNNTCQERYGVAWYCQTEDCRLASKNDSGPNRDFEQLLKNSGISYEREFVLGKYTYDFKVDKTLVEVDPWITHNVDISPYNNPVTKTYHRDKSLAAQQSGYRCIHMWEWDNPQQLIELLKPRNSFFGRCCSVKQVSREEEMQFLNCYHLQGYVKSEIALGLYYQEVLVALMTFGKPRYNKKYQWELLRYCATSKVVGGAQKLFKAFISKGKPESIVSYCDLSKFTGDIYSTLGFKLLRSSVGCHWYSPKTKKHFTDNLVRARGVDQLLGTSYGKGISNEQLLLDEKFVRIYDCGQATYVWTDAQ